MCSGEYALAEYTEVKAVTIKLGEQLKIWDAAVWSWPWWPLIHCPFTKRFGNMVPRNQMVCTMDAMFSPLKRLLIHLQALYLPVFFILYRCYVQKKYNVCIMFLFNLDIFASKKIWRLQIFALAFTWLVNSSSCLGLYARLANNKIDTYPLIPNVAS